jgi:hypothetical protein
VERSKEYAIAEWAECSKCGAICDALFQVDGSDAFEPDLVLGQSVPENVEAPAGRWQIKVVAMCPGCGIRLDLSATASVAIALFENWSRSCSNR